MTQTSPSRQEHESNDEFVQSGPIDSLRPVSGPTGDNDASEKPVREKLKKTSIASISQHTSNPDEAGLETEARVVNEVDPTPNLPTDKATENADIDLARGRPVRKRSFDDIEALEGGTSDAGGVQNEGSNGHARKRSRDVRAGESYKGDRQPRATDTTVQEEPESTYNSSASPNHMSNDSENNSGIARFPAQLPSQIDSAEGSDQNNHEDSEAEEIAAASSPDASKDLPDQEMRDSAPSPRKKRSRDHVDTDVDREQKIPATEEARAQRRSDELDRSENVDASGESSAAPVGSSVPEQRLESETDAIQKDTRELELSNPTPASALGSTSILSPPPANARSISPSNHTVDTESKKSAASFASSGFAALSNSSTSPFGTLGTTSSIAAAPSPFGSSSSFAPRRFERSGGLDEQKVEPANGQSETFHKTSSSGFSAIEPSPFGTAGTAMNSVFGGSVFGGGFGGGFAAGGKLTSFAAPTGDAKVGTSNGTIRPIGSPTHQDHDEENSEGDGEGMTEDDNYGDDVDERFQHKDVETGEDDEITVYSSRASLYTFKEKAWKEGGAGVFKLNKNASSDSAQTSGRFIMRANQTFRILLNAPVLKGMTVGDGQGNEPQKKSFQFAGIENGKVVPYLLKLYSPDESKKLYHEVRRLQEQIGETQ